MNKAPWFCSTSSGPTIVFAFGMSAMLMLNNGNDKSLVHQIYTFFEPTASIATGFFLLSCQHLWSRKPWNCYVPILLNHPPPTHPSATLCWIFLLNGLLWYINWPMMHDAKMALPYETSDKCHIVRLSHWHQKDQKYKNLKSHIFD
jgi:hypothetical protein